jgi:hypothetical protein
VEGNIHADAPQASPTPASAVELRKEATTPKIRYDAEPVGLTLYRSRILFIAGREQYTTAYFGATCRQSRLWLTLTTAAIFVRSNRHLSVYCALKDSLHHSSTTSKGSPLHQIHLSLYILRKGLCESLSAHQSKTFDCLSRHGFSIVANQRANCHRW